MARDWIKPLSFALLCAIWGSTWLVIKEGYGGLGPFNVASVRFLLAGLVFVPIALALRVRAPRGKEWGVVAAAGVLLFAADYGLIYWGEQRLDSGLTAVLFAILPLSTAILAHLYVPGERLSARKLVGILVAILGVAVLFAGNLRLDASLAVPMLAIVGSTLFAAGASVITKRHGHDLHPAALNAGAMILGGIVLAGVSIATGDGYSIPTSRGPWLAIAYLALAGSVVTFLIYFWLMKTWSATSLSFVSVSTPVTALALGALVRGEALGLSVIAGTALIIAGVAIAVLRRGALK